MSEKRWFVRVNSVVSVPWLVASKNPGGNGMRQPLSERFATGRRLVALFLAIMIFGAVGTQRTLAQSESASVFGRVTDQSNAVVPDAEVELRNADTSVSQTTKTNGDGFYVFPYVKPGNYIMSVRKQSFRTVSVTGITLNVQDNLSRNFVLQVGSSSESITVNGSGVNINTTDAAVSTVVDRDFVANMPLNGRSLQDLWALVPGATPASGGGQGVAGDFAVNGQRTEANYFTVDGVSANVGTAPNQFGSGAGFAGGTPAETALGTTQGMVSVDALQEFRATTSTYSAEYGRTPGGQFSFTTRSGSNDWHGSAFDYFRNEVLDANNWFNNAEGIPREKERQNDFGGTLGGPIFIPHVYDGKDKTFFFFSYEGLRLWTPQGVQTSSVPDQALREQAPAALQPVLNAFPLPNKGEDGLNDGLGIYQVGTSYPSSIDSVSVRVDENFSDKFKIFGRYANTPSVLSTIVLAQQTNYTINNRLLTVGATNLISSTQANELRFNITQASSIYSQVFTNAGGAIAFDVTTLPGPGGTNFPSSGGLEVCLCFGGSPRLGLGQSSNSQRQYNITDAYSWTRGRHSLKFGVDWRRLATYLRPLIPFEYVGFASEAAVLANNIGQDGFAEASSQSPSPVEPVYENFSAFGQDEWRITPRFSLSLGLRWDVDPAPSNLTGPSPYTLNEITNLNAAELAPAGTPLWKTDWLGFAPRFGGAYQFRQTPGNQTVLRTGFGVFYDMGNVMGSTGFNGVGFQSVANFTNVSFPLTSAQMTLPPPSVAPPYNGFVYAFDPSLKLPYTLQWNVAIEQALGARQALTISYVGAAGRRLLETYTYAPVGNPNFGSSGCCADITKNGPTSDYNSMQIQFQRTLSRGLQALASYTFSHSIDDASSNFGNGDLLERASSDFDIRHNFQAALTYDVPGQYVNPVVSALLSRWAVDLRFSARSALPVDVIGSYFTNPVTYAQEVFHPNLVPGQPLYLFGSEYPGGRIINYDAFNVPTSGPGYDSEGDTPRNFARAFGSWQMNFALRREFPIHERLHLQFRTEAFNIFNHPSFSFVSNNWTYGPWLSPCYCGFGGAQTMGNQSSSLIPLYGSGGPRSLQIALKLIF
jgi:hypothetical protein